MLKSNKVALFYENNVGVWPYLFSRLMAIKYTNRYLGFIPGTRGRAGTFSKMEIISEVCPRYTRKGWVKFIFLKICVRLNNESYHFCQ